MHTWPILSFLQPAFSSFPHSQLPSSTKIFFKLGQGLGLHLGRTKFFKLKSQPFGVHMANIWNIVIIAGCKWPKRAPLILLSYHSCILNDIQIHRSNFYLNNPNAGSFLQYHPAIKSVITWNDHLMNLTGSLLLSHEETILAVTMWRTSNNRNISWNIEIFEDLKLWNNCCQSIVLQKELHCLSLL